MSAPDRETVDLAVMKILEGFKTRGLAKKVERTLDAFSMTAPELQPALFLADGPEETTDADAKEKGFPPLWTYHYLITGYTNRKSDARLSPDIPMNKLLDGPLGLRNTFPPDAVMGWNDLDGLVARARIAAPIDRFPGSASDQAIMTLPLTVKLKGDNFLGGGAWWFDVGALYLRPGTGPTGLALSDLSPVRVGTLRDIRIRLATTTEFDHYSGGQFPVLARNQLASCSGEFSFGRFQSGLIGRILFPQTVQAGATLLEDRDIQPVPDAGPFYGITAKVPEGGTWDEDMGVILDASGEPLTQADGAPGPGEYLSNDDGTYSFNAAQHGQAVVLAYRYTVPGGSRIALANSEPYDSPTFELNLAGEYNGRRLLLTLPQVVIANTEFRTSIEAFNSATCSFAALGEPGGDVGSLNLS